MASARRGSKPFDRSLVVFLFTDIEDPGELLLRLGAERYHVVSNEHRRLIRAAFERFGGREVDVGDPGFVAFEDGPSTALSAACEILRSVKGHPDPDVQGLHLRIGVHRGEAIRLHQGFVGLNVHRAARISAVAHAGQVLVSQETVTASNEEAAGQFEFRDLGRHRLKDLGEPQRLFQLLIDGVENDFPPLRSLEAFPTNLPIPLTPFIGRESDVKHLVDLLLQNHRRLITLTGPGGVGKTRLALQSAAACIEKFPDGVSFVALAALRTHGHVVSAIAEALGITEATRPLNEVIQDRLRDKAILLVLDNFEHVVSAREIIEELLSKPESPRLVVMTTSRISLGLRDELVYKVPPLSVPPVRRGDVSSIASSDSVALFVDRAKAVKPRFTLTAHNAEAVANICRLLDGIPLAIELAAARVKLFAPSALYRKLSDHVADLSSKAHDVTTRHRSLTAALEWSYDLLNADEQELFKRLSIFSSGWTKEAMVEVCDPDDCLNATEAEVTLINNNLLAQQEVESDTPRSLMLIVVREFALERLKQASLWMDLKARHAAYFEKLAKQIVPHVRIRPELLKQFDLEDNNLLEAINWAFEVEDTRSVLTLAASVWDPWYVLGHWTNARRIIDKAIRYGIDHDSANSNPELFCEVLCAGCLFSAMQSDFSRAEEVSSKLLELSHRIDFKRGKAFASIARGIVAYSKDSVEEAIALTQRCYEIAREISDYMLLTSALGNLAGMYALRGEFKTAEAILVEALGLAEQAPDMVMTRVLLCTLGEVSIEQGNLKKAGEFFIRALEVAGSVDTIMHILAGAAVVSRCFDPCSALILEAYSDTLSEQLAAPFMPGQMKRSELVTDLKLELGDEAFGKYWQRGQDMGLDEAVELANRVLEQATREET